MSLYFVGLVTSKSIEHLLDLGGEWIYYSGVDIIQYMYEHIF